MGVLNTGLSYLAYASLLLIDLHYTLASLGSLLFGLAWSFFTQGKLVFKNLRAKLFPKFVLGWGLIYLCHILCLGLFQELGISPYGAGLLSIPFVIAASYSVQKFYVFRT